jgi:hypothetical protein
VSASGKPLQIDIPVKLGEVKTVFSIDALAFEGDLPASLFHLQLIENDITDWKAKAEVIAVFHTNAGHVTLNDSDYNSDRIVATGNPYKELVAQGANRVVWCYREGSSLGKRRSASRHQGQYGCDGENDAARSRGVRENYRMNRRASRNRSVSRGLTVFARVYHGAVVPASVCCCDRLRS